MLFCFTSFFNIWTAGQMWDVCSDSAVGTEASSRLIIKSNLWIWGSLCGDGYCLLKHFFLCRRASSQLYCTRYHTHGQNNKPGRAWSCVTHSMSITSHLSSCLVFVLLACLCILASNLLDLRHKRKTKIRLRLNSSWKVTQCVPVCILGDDTFW